MWRLLLFFWIVSVPAAACGTGGKTVLVLGDSLSAGYGLGNIDDGWVALLQKRLEEEGYSYRVVNASISGDTTSGARARLDAALETVNPAVAIIELGGNDGLRGIGIEEVKRNLRGIIERLLENDIQVLLIPMELPPNYGAAYIDRFRAIYAELAADLDITLGRFILDDIALDPDFMQEDGIHPRAAAQPRMVDNVLPALLPLVRDCAGAS